MFILLFVILIVFVSAFIAFFKIARKMSFETFKRFSQKKIMRFAKRRKLLSITNLNIANFDSERISVNHVIFGKKYIYLISDFLLKGFVSGEENDNSWLYYDNVEKRTHYLSNLNMISDKNIRDFSAILQISPDPIVSICLVPNICDFKVKQDKNSKKIIVHYSSLNRKIRRFERQEIGSLNQEQIYEHYTTIKERNEKERI